MIRKIQTSQGRRRKFYHEDSRCIAKENDVIRPPTSHPYSAMKNLRSPEPVHCRFDSNAYQNKFSQDNLQDKRERELFHELRSKQIFTPKKFSHLIGQIKILIRNANIEEPQHLYTLFNSLTKKIGDLYQQNQKNITLLKQKEMQLQKASEQIEILNKKLKKMELNNEMRQSHKKNSNKTSEMEMMLQNLRLAQLNEVYLSKLNQIQMHEDDRKVTQTKKEVNQNDNTEILRFHNRISYLEMKLKNSEEKQNMLSADNQRLICIIASLKEQATQIKKKSDEMNERLCQWRERALMQNQDSQMHLARQNFLLFSIKKLRESNKSLTDKLINQGGQDQTKKQQIQPNPYFQYQIDFFRSIKSVYFQAKFKEFKINLQNKKNENIEFEAMGLQQEYLQYRKHEQINLSHYTFYMPTFFSFIQESITNEISSCRVKGNASVSRIFIQLLRSILNSKTNEFMMYSDEEKYKKFPQFVYTWFQKFYFNSQKNDISALEPYMQKPFPQDLFYRDLMNIKLDQSWEIITFRQFLLEQLSLEELYFYLMCQNLLYRKAGITKEIQYMGEFCILAEYSAAKAVLDMVLSDFQSWNLSFLTSKLREKIVYKKNVEYIECGFFLRCLVEYYKIQRINRYKYINKLCNEFKSCEKGLRFSSFISVINRFTEVSVDQKIQLYRDCYCVGKGKINADIIFTVCSEHLIFLKYLKLKCFYKLPLLTTQRSLKNAQMAISKKSTTDVAISNKALKPIICVQPSNPYLYRIFISMISLLKNDQHFMKRAESFGVVDIMNQILSIQKIFSDKVSNNDSSLLKCKHFIHFISQTISNVRLLNFQNFYELLEQQGKKRNNNSFWIDIDENEICQIFEKEFSATFNVFNKITEMLIWKNRVYTFRVNNAARKIQRQVRKKFIAPFIELYKIIYSQFKNPDQEKQEKK